MAKERLSQTMRIDLIPDVPKEAEGARRRKLIITAPGRQRRARTKASTDTKGTFYNELLQSIYDAALICDMSGRIVDVNARAVEFLLRPRDELAAMTVFDIISGADESLIETLCENLEEDRYTLIQAYCQRKNGTTFPSEIAVNKLNLGEMHLCFFVRDITWRRQAEEMLRTEHNAIQNAFNGIAVANIDACLEYANPAVARMWGFENSDELLGADVRDLVCDRDKASEMIGTVMGDGHSWSGEMLAARVDGNEFDLEVSAACNRDSDGEIVGVVFSFVDISDRKQAESVAREAERQRVMLESLGAACHHLGQPATVLVANLGLLRKRIGKTDAENARLLQSCIDAIGSLGKTLHKLNAVNEYRTTDYLSGDEDGEAASRILDIDTDAAAASKKEAS